MRHYEGADLFKDDCAFLRQGFCRATMRERQVPVGLHGESSAPSLDTDDCVSVSVDVFLQFHYTGYRLQGSIFEVLAHPFNSVFRHIVDTAVVASHHDLFDRYAEGFRIGDVSLHFPPSDEGVRHDYRSA